MRYVYWAYLGLIVSACATPPNPIDLPDQVLPAAVQDALPDDIPSGAVVRDDAGCYAYSYAHSLIEIEDSAGKQICLP